MSALTTLAVRNVRTGFFRFVATLLAIALSVGFIVGTSVFSATLTKTFDDLFASSFKGTDSYVRSANVVTSQGVEQRSRVESALVDEVRKVDGVAAAEASIFGYAGLLNKDGEFVNPPSAAPMFGLGWINDDALNPYDIFEGRPPTAAGEVVIDRGSAKRTGYRLGDKVRVATKGAPQDYTLVGIAKFGTADGPSGATISIFSEKEAESLITEPGKIDGVAVRAATGITQVELTRRISAKLPKGLEAVTGAQITKENQDTLGKFIDILGTFLLAFALVASLVGAFVIWNTFSVLLAQRVRQLALLRAVGAGRGQLTRSVLVEALFMGVIGTIAGFGLGILFAFGIRALFNGLGGQLPGGSPVITPFAIIMAFVIGIGVTVLCALWPSFRATGVPPIAAMRDVAFERKGNVRVRAIIGGLLLVAAIAGVAGSAIGAKPLYLGISVLVLLIAVVVAGPLLADTVGRLLGIPVAATGTEGRLAARNSMRNPKRTASTALALTLGAMLVSGFTLLGAAIRDQINSQITDQVRSDLLIDATNGGPGFGGLSPQFLAEVKKLPEVSAATSSRFTVGRIDGKPRLVAGRDPFEAEVFFDLGVQQGRLADLGNDGLAVADSVAKESGWKLGSKVRTELTKGGPQEFTVRAIFKGSDFTTPVFVSKGAFDLYVQDNYDGFIQINAAEGVSIDKAKISVKGVMKKYGSYDVQDLKEFRDSISAQINQTLGLLYALLALAVIIAILGIVNTLGLSVVERTRELGLTRAVGATRGQVKRMIRWESVIVAVFGSLLGIVLGIILGSAFIYSLRNEGIESFTIPWSSMLVILLLAAVVGVLAAILPARRAAKLDILQAIATS